MARYQPKSQVKSGQSGPPKWGQLWWGSEIAPATTPPITTPRTAASQAAQTAPAANAECRSTEAKSRSRVASGAGISPVAGTRCATRRE
jgi:hypothetical protein